MGSASAVVRERWGLKQGHLNALLLGALLGQIGFWLWFCVPRLTTEPFGTDDFAAFWSVASMVLDGRASQIYDVQTVAALQSSLGLPQTIPYFYPPFFLVFVLPFASLSPGLAYLLWGVANLAVLGLSVWLLARNLVPPGNRLTFALLVASSMPAGRNLYLGQTSFVLLLGLTISILGFIEGRDRRSGLASTLLLIKPQLLPVWVLTLLWYRRFRALAYLVAGAATLMLLSTAIVGTDGMAGYLRSLLAAGGADRVGFQAMGSHTLAGLAYTVGDESSSKPIYLLLAAATVAIYCYWLIRLGRHTKTNLRVAAALVVVTALLVSPHSLLYDLALWAVPLALYWRELSAGWGRWVVAAGYLTPWFVSFFGMLGAGLVWPTVAVGIAGFALLGREAAVHGGNPIRDSADR